jgi:hypothetical protein
MALAMAPEWRLRAIGAAIFAFTVAQDPLYTANQNTKYLHGAAAERYGDLARDWMANTVDPLPVFTWLVRALFHLGVPELSYGIFALLAGCCAWWLTSVVTAAGLVRREHTLPFMAGLVLTQAVLAKWPRGLAEQYLLDHYLQPCVFGVLLIAAVAAYLRARSLLAVMLAAIAALIHPDYLPTTIACCIVFATVSPSRERFDPGHGWRLLAVAALLLTPLLLHIRWLFTPTTPELFQRSLDVLVRYRIPHHTEVAYWFDAHEALRVIVMIVGTWLAPSRGLRHLMATLLALVIGSLILTEFFDLEAVAAITPWRASVLLVPLALAVIVARGVSALERRWPHRGELVTRAAWALLAIACLVGAVRQVDRVRGYADASTMPTLRWIRDARAPGWLYVVPTRDLGFDRFRLVTGVPILVNWKTHPYRDVEIIEWHRRIEAVEKFYASTSADDACATLRGLAATFGVTHAVIPDAHPLDTGVCAGVVQLHGSPGFRVVRIGSSGL